VIKVLHIIWKANFGGIEKVVYQLAEQQQKSDKIKSAVLILRPEGEYLERFISASFPLFCLNFKSGKWTPPAQLRKLRETAKEFDLIHLHSFNPWVFFALVFSQKKLFYSEHGNFGFGRRLSLLDKLILKIRTYGINHFASGVSYNSNFTKRYAEDQLGYAKGNNRKVVYNGVAQAPKQEKESKNLDTEDRPFLVGTWSRFAEVKRIDRLIKAFNEFQKNKKTSLLLIGDGPTISNLKSLCKCLKITNQVKFLGYMEKPEEVIDSIDICVFPSRGESFGLVAIEALQFGKPTVVFKDGGGLAEIIEPISEKDIVKDVDALTARLEECYLLWQGAELNTKENIDMRIARAKNFSIQGMSAHLEEIYLNC